jgi:RHS repeat-associated protein
VLPARALPSPRMHWRNRRRVRRRTSGRSFVYNPRFPGQYYDSETGLNYNYFRDYDPALGRYIESDPIGLTGGSYSTYSYVGDDTLKLADPLGTKPGDSFPTAEAAAIDALNYINTQPHCATNEHAGWVYKEWSLFGNSSYTYDEPEELSPTGGLMPPMPVWHTLSAMFHTHPAIPGYDSNNYSPQDEDTADANGIPSYLGINPSGLIKRYTPSRTRPRGGNVATVGATHCLCGGN